MTLTPEDLQAIKITVTDEINQRIDDLTHSMNLRLTAIELRLDGIDYTLSQIKVFVPYENAFLIPPIKNKKER